MSEIERDRDAPGGPFDADAGASSDPPETDDGEADSTGPSVDVQSYIGVQLRAVYDDVAKQPIPDRFLELMRRLD